MGAPKGHACYGGGRSKGSPNKSTIAVKEIFQSILEGEIGNVQDALEQVRTKSPEKYVDLILKLSAYIIPKPQSSIDITSNGDKVPTILSIDPLSSNK